MIIRANNLTIEVNGNTPQMVEYIMNVVYLLILYRIVREIKWPPPMQPVAVIKTKIG